MPAFFRRLKIWCKRVGVGTSWALNIVLVVRVISNIQIELREMVLHSPITHDEDGINHVDAVQFQRDNDVQPLLVDVP